MDIYYVRESIQVPFTFYEYQSETFFDSKEAMDEYISRYVPDNLRGISSKGKAHFNSKGILVPNGKRHG